MNSPRRYVQVAVATGAAAAVLMATTGLAGPAQAAVTDPEVSYKLTPSRQNLTYTGGRHADFSSAESGLTLRRDPWGGFPEGERYSLTALRLVTTSGTAEPIVLELAPGDNAVSCSWTGELYNDGSEQDRHCQLSAAVTQTSGLPTLGQDLLLEGGVPGTPTSTPVRAAEWAAGPEEHVDELSWRSPAQSTQFDEQEGVGLYDRRSDGSRELVGLVDVIWDRQDLLPCFDYSTPCPYTTFPDAPTNPTVGVGYGYADVAWTAPASDGGAPLAGYTVTASPGGRQVQVPVSQTTARLYGLDNGTEYTFTVTARHRLGTSQPSEPSSPVVVQGGPGAAPSPSPSASATPAAAPRDDLRVSISSPQESALYNYGQQVPASWTCETDSGPTVCTGEVTDYTGLSTPHANGDLLDTSRPGTYYLGVTGRDSTGALHARYVDYTVSAPGDTSTTVSGGETVSTGDTATADAPVQTSIKVPVGTSGTLSVDAQPAGTSPSGFQLFGQQLVIDGPAATVESPYEVSFLVDSSQLGGVAPADIQVFRNGLAAGACTEPTAAVPDPCVVSRSEAPSGAGDALVVVRTSHFSTWTLGRLAYDFEGPFAPVAAAPTMNARKAGAAVPVKFKLGGDRGLNVLAQPPSSTTFACDSTERANEGKPTGSAATSSLSYDAGTRTYTLTWKTSSTMKGCRDLVLRFRDGSKLRTLYRLS
ncbi:MAG: PxKF domain-containing protein [Actinobacteria bacterium]|nr:PxKF domain-containing protein [Actinomycetota bacterium]MCA1721806.1 PxKF domain-containing protein [Actinomycetota bacterium]